LLSNPGKKTCEHLNIVAADALPFRLGTMSQSYDRDLQRQRCNFLQRHG
jgi:hypothetical protein